MGYSLEPWTALISETPSSTPEGERLSSRTSPRTVTLLSWPSPVASSKVSSSTSFLTTTPWTKPLPSRSCRKAILPLDRTFMTQAWIWACSPTSCGNLSIVVLLICVSLSRTVGAPDVSPAQDLLERLEHAALVHRLAQGGVDLLQLRFAVRHDARVANDLEHGDVSAAVANRHDVFQLHTERFDDAAQAAALVDAGAGDAYEGSAGQGWRRPGSDLRSVDRDRLGLLTLSGLDQPLWADHRLAERHLVQVAHECVDADEFGVLLQRRGAPLDVDVRGRVQLQRVVQFPRPCHQVEDVLLLQRGRVQGVAVGFCYDRAVLEDVAVAGTDPLRDAQDRKSVGQGGR